MADSSYYKDKYKQNEKKVKEYKENIKDLEEINRRINNNFSDEQNAVNRELTDLKEDLEKAVRHDSRFGTNVNNATKDREKSSFSDSNLDSAVTSLENEIRDLENKKRQEEDNQRENQRKYKEKKDQEQKEFWDKIFK